MGTTKSSRSSDFILSILFIAFVISYNVVYANEICLVVGQSTKLHLFPGSLVKNSAGLKPGTKFFCERVSIHGLSRLRDLRKFSHSVNVKVSQNRLPSAVF